MVDVLSVIMISVLDVTKNAKDVGVNPFAILAGQSVGTAMRKIRVANVCILTVFYIVVHHVLINSTSLSVIFFVINKEILVNCYVVTIDFTLHTLTISFTNLLTVISDNIALLENLVFVSSNFFLYSGFKHK